MSIRATSFLIEVGVLLKFDGIWQYPAKERWGKERDLTVAKVDEYAVTEFVGVRKGWTLKRHHLRLAASPRWYFQTEPPPQPGLTDVQQAHRIARNKRNQFSNMNYAHIALASLGAMVAYFAYGFVMFAAWPSMKTEFMKYPNVYRPEDKMMKMMPTAWSPYSSASWSSMILYAKVFPAGGGVVSGASLGALIGIFTVCIFVIHNYVNLNIGLKLTLYQCIAYFIQWVIVGSAIGLIYKPS